MGQLQIPAPSANAIMNELRITSSTTWTAPSGVNKVWVLMIGGGGGASATTSTAVAVPGTTGGIVNQQVSISAGTTYSAVIGAGGSNVGGGSNGNSGNNTTMFGLTAVGGQGGQRQLNFSGGGYQGGGINWSGGVNGVAYLDDNHTADVNTGNSGTGTYNQGAAGGSGLIILRWAA